MTAFSVELSAVLTHLQRVEASIRGAAVSLRVLEMELDSLRTLALKLEDQAAAQRGRVAEFRRNRDFPGKLSLNSNNRTD